jgi:hypothetical protein
MYVWPYSFMNIGSFFIEVLGIIYLTPFLSKINTYTLKVRAAIFIYLNNNFITILSNEEFFSVFLSINLLFECGILLNITIQRDWNSLFIYNTFFAFFVYKNIDFFSLIINDKFSAIFIYLNSRIIENLFINNFFLTIFINYILISLFINQDLLFLSQFINNELISIQISYYFFEILYILILIWNKGFQAVCIYVVLVSFFIF